jgi:hypothetical protein
MESSKGRPAIDQLDALRNRIWAARVVHQSCRPASKISPLYPRTSSGQLSSIFSKTLALGRPTPRLKLDDGSEGPALLLEKEFPGSLYWLLHPIWPTLRSLAQPCYRIVFSTAKTLQDLAGVIVLSAPLEGDDILFLKLKHLKALGTMDSLTGLLLLAQLMFLSCRPSGYVRVEQFAHDQVKNWKCLSWLSNEIREEFCDYLLHHLVCCTPYELPTDEEARNETTARALITLDEENLCQRDVFQISLVLYPGSS